MKVDTQINILVAEDDLSIKSLMVEDLRSLGFEGQIFEAENGVDAYKIFQSNSKLDLIISDIQMPEMNGIELLQRIRAHKDGQHVPFLMVTSDDAKETIITCVDNKASNYIVKPWNKQILIKKIVTCFEKERGVENAST